MPIAVRHDPFQSQPQRQPTSLCIPLRIPQARVLRALLPDAGVVHVDWPIATAVAIARSIGVSEVSDYVRRALHGLREGSSSGSGHPGLIALGLVEVVLIDTEGVVETTFRITPSGVIAILAHGDLPPVRDREGCINKRYRRESP